MSTSSPDSGPQAPAPDTNPTTPPDTSTPDAGADTSWLDDVEELGDGSGEKREKVSAMDRVKGGFADTAKGLFGGAWESLSKRFMGKLTAKERRQAEMDAGQLADLSARTALSLTTSIMGVKAFHDVPAYLVQKIATHLERGEILKALTEVEKDREANGEASEGELALQAKLDAMFAKVDASERMTDKKKEEVKKALYEKVSRATSATAEARKQRNKEVATILEDAIQTRIKGRQALKEAVNTALMASGLSMLRGTAYGAFALHERMQKIEAENKNPEFKTDKSYFNRLLFDGIRQGAEKIRTGGNAETRTARWLTRGAGVIEVLTPALRAAGFADLMIDEFVEEEGISGAFNKIIEQYHKNDGNLLRVGLENTQESLGRFGETASTLKEGAGYMGGAALDAVFGTAAEAAEPTQAMQAAAETIADSAGESLEDTGTSAEANLEGTERSNDSIDGAGEAQPPTQPQEAPLAAATVEGVPDGEGVDTTELPVDVAETSTDTEPQSFTEYPEAQRELALTQKGDGILRLLSRQLKANPEQFGFDGDATDSSEVNAWVRKTTMEAARAQGIVRPDGDTRLTTEAIENLSVLAKAKEDGSIEIVFFNGTEQVDADGLREAGLIYESGTPGLIASSGERAQMRLTEGRAFDIPESLEDSDAPNELMNGRITIFSEDGTLDRIAILGELSTGEQAQVESIVNFDAANEQFGDIEPNEEIVYERVDELSREIVATHKLILKLEKEGFGTSPEAEFLRSKLQQDIIALDLIDEQFKGPHLLDANALLPMIKETHEFNPSTLASAEGPTEGINRLKIRGMERVSFTYTAEGKPQIDLSEAIRDMKPTLAGEAKALMAEGWQDTVETYTLTEGRQVGEQVGRQTLLLTGAIRELNNVGHGNSPEARYLKHHLATLLNEYGNILNADNELTQQAFAYASEVGFETDSLEAVAEDSNVDTKKLPSIERPDTDTGTNDTDLPPVARPDADAGAAASNTRPTEGWIPAERSNARASLLERGDDTVFKSDSGKMRFEYNDRGEVIDASAPARMYTLNNAEVNAALAPYGFTRVDLQRFDAMYEKDDFRLDRMEYKLGRLEHQREILADMQRAGLQGEPEYAFLLERTQQAEEAIGKQLASVDSYLERVWGQAADQTSRERALAMERLEQRKKLIALGAEGDFRNEGIAFSGDNF